MNWYLVVFTTVEGKASIEYEVDGVEARDKFHADQLAIQRNGRMVANKNCSLRTAFCLSKRETRRARRLHQDHLANHGNLRPGLEWNPEDWTLNDFIVWMGQPPYIEGELS